jgi:uncharacterized protein (TIGR00730 family)
VKERVIAIYGSSSTPEDHQEYTDARRLGRLLAESGFVVSSGGYGGIMEAVSRGAREAGGQTIGVTCGIFTDRGGANRWIDREIFTHTLFERIETVVHLAEAYIALPGGPGTLAEVALTWNLLQRQAIPSGPLVMVGEVWERILGEFGRSPWVRPQDMSLLRFAGSVEAALEMVTDGRC